MYLNLRSRLVVVFLSRRQRGGQTCQERETRTERERERKRAREIGLGYLSFERCYSLNLPVLSESKMIGTSGKVRPRFCESSQMQVVFEVVCLVWKYQKSQLALT